ncbi:MAG: hypothetical protein A2289_00810 [Deltaproteobacteria bacterium RIFOXYA12_FULL_58_15]|nr:MAG: hypothetical protein A2289_00810 [Deltaproteobacteria bacterium RIFOXYA12_FULL_58_15]OGR11250.1 MAG: hypothetical protein A2341_17565 [Deltaproteobacteria bacterium RIFOXYB12_FULL_58_9]
MKKLRVLVIDDSAYNRKTLTELLQANSEIEVVGRAYDGEEGLKLVASLKPDLITLDIEMPRMDGFTFLRILMHQMPTPVIVISSHSRKEEVFQALELGALDFVAKPSHHIAPDLKELGEELISKVLAIRGLRALPGQAAPAKNRHAPKEPMVKGGEVDRVVCIGASTGGPPALESIFKSLPSFASTAFLVAQHMPEKFTRAFADRLNRMVDLDVHEAEGGTRITAGNVYVAPGGSHMVVAKGTHGPVLHIVPTEDEDRYTPSIDRLLESAAEHYHQSLLAILLTGMGSDGSVGIEVVRRLGGRTLAESEETAVVFGMPKEAIATGCVDEVLALSLIIERIQEFAAARRP